MGTKICAYNAIFEVTRRCNLSCEHCLRGDAQNLDMTKETVDKVLDHIESIGCLTFSGGEPTLNIPIIRYIFSEIWRREIPLDSFYVVTNGLVNQMELAQVLLENIPYCNEPDMCGVSISTDIFHDNNKEAFLSPIRYLSFSNKDKESGDYFGGRGIIRRGRAASNVFNGGRTDDPTIDFEGNAEYDESCDCICLDGEFYVSAAGEICADCDLSYEMMNDYFVTTVDALPQFIEELKVEEEESANHAA